MLYLENLPAKLDNKTKYYTTKQNQRSKTKIRIWIKPQINIKRDSRKILKFNIKRDSRKILTVNIKRDSRKILITKLQLKFLRERNIVNKYCRPLK